MIKYNISSYLNQFKKTDISYLDYKNELINDLNNILDEYGNIGVFKLNGSIVEHTTGESDIPLFLISPTDYNYAREIVKKYAIDRL